MLRYVTTIVLATLIAACGTKGPLFLPPTEPAPAAQSPQAPAAPTDAYEDYTVRTRR